MQVLCSSQILGWVALWLSAATQLQGVLKMGDTPFVSWLLRGTPGDPAQPSWGGRSVRAWTRPYGRFDRLTTKDAKTYRYTLRSNAAALDGKTGEITSVSPPIEAALSPDPRLPHWWTDDPSPALDEGLHHGARTVNCWREALLRDFATRLERCRNRSPSNHP